MIKPIFPEVILDLLGPVTVAVLSGASSRVVPISILSGNAFLLIALLLESFFVVSSSSLSLNLACISRSASSRKISRTSQSTSLLDLSVRKLSVVSNLDKLPFSKLWYLDTLSLVDFLPYRLVTNQVLEQLEH